LGPTEGEIVVSRHPLIERAAQREVRQAKGFREAAAGLTGEILAAEYAAEREGAPHRSAAGKKHFVAPNKRLLGERRPARDSEHAAVALVGDFESRGQGLALPDDAGILEPIHAGCILKSAPADRQKGAEDPNFGIDRVDLLAVGPEDRLAVVVMRFLAPEAGRVGTGDTPLRVLLEGLAHVAVAEANRDALVAECAGRSSRSIRDLPPALVLLGSPRYWQLCRKREAQKGAAWIKEIERLIRELREQIDVPVLPLSLRLKGDPGWSYDSGAPVLEAPPRLDPAWEPGAGRLRPKPRARPRARSQEPQEVLVEADLSRPVRSYALTELYSAGDRIQHPTLGLGVVQGVAGAGKIRVLFDEKKSVLVHDRPGTGGAA